MDSIEKIIGVLLVIAIVFVLFFINGDISRMVFYPSGGFRKFVYNSIRKIFS